MLKAAVCSFVALILSGCATSSTSIAPPARGTEVPADLSFSGPPRIRMPALPGWTRIEIPPLVGEAVAGVGFRNDSTGSLISFRASPACAHAGALDRILQDTARLLDENLRVTCVPRVAAGDYSSMRCSGGGSDPSRGLIAVRRPSGRCDVLLIMSGIWSDSLPKIFDEEVELIFLHATAE